GAPGGLERRGVPRRPGPSSAGGAEPLEQRGALLAAARGRARGDRSLLPERGIPHPAAGRARSPLSLQGEKRAADVGARDRGAAGAHAVNRAAAERDAAAVLYEGYLLYPYRRSALKNRQRWPFGALYPRGWAEANGERSSMASAQPRE